MPVLQISDGHGQLDLFAWSEVLALTAFPDDEAARAEFAIVIAFQALEAHIDEDNFGALLQALIPSIPALLRARSLAEVIAAGRKGTETGALAGVLLLFQMSAATHHRDCKPSLAAAIHALARLLGPKRVRAGKRTLERKWSTYKPVSHFLAMPQIPALADEGPAGVLSLFGSEFPRYLALAEAVRESAERLGVVAPGDLWSAPRDLFLPDVGTFQVDPLSEERLAALRSYRPPHSRAR